LAVVDVEKQRTDSDDGGMKQGRHRKGPRLDSDRAPPALPGRLHVGLRLQVAITKAREAVMMMVLLVVLATL